MYRMQLKVIFNFNETLELPIGYHHILQAALYQCMIEDGEDQSFYHNASASFGKRKYRLFTFGPLQGKYHISQKRITFYDRVALEIRSADIHCIQLLQQNLRKNGIRFGDRIIIDIDIEMKDTEIEVNDLLIRMSSPICVYKTDMLSGHITYWRPDQIEFFQYVNANFLRKYKATYGINAEEDISLEAVHITSKDKYVTRYKDTHISGWKGIYRLKGKRKYLDFLYQTGLGSKNSMGFGMFDIIESR